MTLIDQAQRDRISGAAPGSLDETLFVEAGAGSGKTHSLVTRITALVRAGVPMREIAAITFTEKAAAELRDRVRRELETLRAAPGTADDDRRRARAALDELDAAAICTLHAFARRLLTEQPIEAALPPNVEVLDEVASEIEFEDRWRRTRDELLDDGALDRTLLLADALGVGLDGVRSLVRQFDDNWDLIGDPRHIPWDAAPPPDVRDAAAPLIEAIDAAAARADECDDPTDTLATYLREEVAPSADALRTAADEYLVVELLRGGQPTYRAGNKGRKDVWPDKQSVLDDLYALIDLRDRVLSDITEAVLHRLAVTVRDVVLGAAEQRRAAGRLEFHDLLVMARQLLRTSPEARAALSQRYRRLLLDEFQDTDPIQIELAVLLAAAGDPDEAAWDEVDTEPGRLFFVGDPKQSIYRFRRADIALFLAAQRRFGGDDTVRLTTNFRSVGPVLDWVNHVFGDLIRHEEDSQPGYQPLTADRGAPPGGPPVTVLGADPLPRSLYADDVRDREAAAVVDTIETALAESWQVRDGDAWRDCALGDITILLPARTSLPQLEAALDDRDIPYRAENSSLVYSTPAIRELMAAVRAIADPTDQLSLVTALRSPLFGCGDDDLLTFARRHGGRFDVTHDLPDDLPDDHPVGVALRELGTLHDAAAWSTPAELLERLTRDRRTFELGYVTGRPRDLWRRLRFVIDQARAWSEEEGGTLREYAAWARMQSSESARVAETILPESDDDSVRIMTVHAAKGLEFPITILSGMSARPHRAGRGVQVSWPREGPIGIKANATVKTREYEAFEPIDEQMDHHERIRLLYVACTRAEDHLVVSLFRSARASEPSSRSVMKNSELLAAASRDAPHQVELTGGRGRPRTADGTPPATEPPPLERWRATRDETLATSSRRRSVGASDVHTGPPDPGHRKHPRDLDLPAWQKGRYGTAVGRAVHAVLQTVDLATGEGLEQAAHAQAAAEGIVGREEQVAALARSALSSPTVQASTHARRWRETYVATTVGGTTLEGYVDLLYRTADGLVVVDYKTAAAGADLDRRVGHYRDQGAAYALAVEQAAGEPVAGVVFVFLTPDGPVDRSLPDLAGAIDAVRASLEGSG